MRLIDADELIKCIPSEEYNSRFAVMNAPTVEPQKWIPLSERLPEDEQVVLVQDTNGTMWIWKYFCENLEYRGSYQWMDDNGAWQLIDEVVAWMPLPEPWKGEEQ